MQETLISIAEATQSFNISRTTLGRWTRDGRIPYVMMKNKKMIEKGMLSEIMEANKLQIESYQKRNKKRLSTISLKQKEWLTATEAAKAFGIDQGAVWYHGEHGRISTKTIKWPKQDIKVYNRLQIEAIAKKTRETREKKEKPSRLHQGKKWLTIKQAAKLYDISTDSIWRYANIDKIATFKTQDAVLYNRYDIEDLAKVFEEKKEQFKSNIIPLPGPCITQADGKDIFDKLKLRLANDLRTLVLFDDTVELIDPAFFDAAVGRLYDFLPVEKIRGNLVVEGLTEDDLVVLRTVVFLARQNANNQKGG